MSKCESDRELLKALFKKHEEVLGSKPIVFTLIQNFDSLKISVEKLDFFGCFLPWDADVETGPNARRFLGEPSKHVDVSHIYTKKISSSVTNIRKSQTTLTGQSSSIKKPALSLNIYKTNNQCTLQNNVKANQISIQQRTMDDYNKKVNLIGDCKNKKEDFA